MNDTLRRLNDIFKDVFEDEDVTVDRDTTAADVEGWDSLRHVTLILAVEHAFRVRFSSSAVASLKSVGELADLIEAQSGR